MILLQKNTELKTNSLFLAEIAEFALLVVPFASLLATHSDLEGKKRFNFSYLDLRSAEPVDATRQSQAKMDKM